jgi:hypothetical protein
MSLLDIPFRIGQVRDALTLLRTSWASDAAAAAAQRDTLNTTMGEIAASVATMAGAAELVSVANFPVDGPVGKLVHYAPQGSVFVSDGDWWKGPRVYISAPPFVAMPYTGVSPAVLGYLPDGQWGGAFWCEAIQVMTAVQTTNNVSNFWQVSLATPGGTILGTLSTAAHAAGATVDNNVAINAFLPAGGLTMRVTGKSGAPGGLFAAMVVYGHMRIAV